jgi:hypothetical protein
MPIIIFVTMQEKVWNKQQKNMACHKLQAVGTAFQ